MCVRVCVCVCVCVCVRVCVCGGGGGVGGGTTSIYIPSQIKMSVFVKVYLCLHPETALISVPSFLVISAKQNVHSLLQAGLYTPIHRRFLTRKGRPGQVGDWWAYDYWYNMTRALAIRGSGSWDSLEKLLLHPSRYTNPLIIILLVEIPQEACCSPLPYLASLLPPSPPPQKKHTNGGTCSACLKHKTP